MSQAIKPQKPPEASSENKIRKGTLLGTAALIVVALIVLYVGVMAYDRVGGSWVQHRDDVGSTKSPEMSEPGTLQYGGSNAFPRTDPVR
jgi:cytochrome c-type biogenesis protein CcmH/NrfG